MPGGPPWFHPGRSGTVQIGPQNILGHFGELHPRVVAALNADGPLVAFEVILEKIPEPKQRSTRAKAPLELSPFQPVERDFAFVVDSAVRAADIIRAAQNVAVGGRRFRRSGTGGNESGDAYRSGDFADSHGYSLCGCE